MWRRLSPPNVPAYALRTPARRHPVLMRAFAVRVAQVRSAFVLWVLLVASILAWRRCGPQLCCRRCRQCRRRSHGRPITCCPIMSSVLDPEAARAVSEQCRSLIPGATNVVVNITLGEQATSSASSAEVHRSSSGVCDLVGQVFQTESLLRNTVSMYLCHSARLRPDGCDTAIRGRYTYTCSGGCSWRVCASRSSYGEWSVNTAEGSHKPECAEAPQAKARSVARRKMAEAVTFEVVANNVA